MKTVLTTAILFFSAQAICCPNLSGKFTCQDIGSANNWTWEYNASQSVNAAGFTIYANGFNQDVVIADNVEHIISRNNFIMTYKAWCENEVLIKIATITFTGRTPFSVQEKSYRTVYGQLIFEGTMSGIPMKAICTPNN